MKRKLKTFILIIGSITLKCGLLYIIGMWYFGGFYDKDGLVDNYHHKETEILAVKSFLKGKLPEQTYVDIEFDFFGLTIFHMSKNGVRSNNWEKDLSNNKVDSLLNELGWTAKDLETLEDKLSAANCISVASGNPVTIGWQRRGGGMYSYKIFDEVMDAKTKADYPEGCNSIFFKNNVILQYWGGAIGRQCFTREELETESIKSYH